LAEKPSLQVDHPVAKYCEVLGDLELWHTERREIEAAFEARLERLRRLRSNFTEKTDRERIKKDLEARLPGVRTYPWWSLGMATLAEFVKEEDTPTTSFEPGRLPMMGRLLIRVRSEESAASISLSR